MPKINNSAKIRIFEQSTFIIVHRNPRHPQCVMNIDMKMLIITASAVILLAACGRSHVEAEYSADTCDELAVRIDRRDSLSQADYAEMIRQS